MRGTNAVGVAGKAIQCWLTELVSDPRLEEVVDKTIESVSAACAGYEFALLIMVDDELTVARTSGLGPGARRRLELWARSSAKLLVDPLEIDDLRSHPELAGLAARLT